VVSISRALISIALAGLLTGLATLPAAARTIDVPASPGRSSGRATAVPSQAFAVRTASTTSLASTKPVCQDRAFKLSGGRWAQAVHWTFDADSTPPGLSVAAVESVLVESFNNITRAHNDCGRPDNVSAHNVYEGRAGHSPDLSRFAMCTKSDGFNSVGFGLLPKGVLAATCTRPRAGHIVEADIRINTRYDWALTVGACFKQELLEPTITHEVGHVYGLAHVSERLHPLLTMSRASDGPCNNEASTLGLGDMLGLEKLY
jgi:hypothetical protein